MNLLRRLFRRRGVSESVVPAPPRPASHVGDVHAAIIRASIATGVTREQFESTFWRTVNADPALRETFANLQAAGVDVGLLLQAQWEEFRAQAAPSAGMVN